MVRFPILVFPPLIALALFSALFFNGFNIGYYSTSLLLMLGWGLLSLVLIYHNNESINFSPLMLLMLFFPTWLGISLLFHPVPYLGKMNFWWVGAFAFVFLIYAIRPLSEKAWIYVVGLVAVMAVGLACYAFYQSHILHLAPNAVFYNKNSLAALLNLVVFLLISAIFTKEHNNPWFFSVGLLAIAFSIYMLGIINSRAALLAFIIACSIFIFLTGKHLDHSKRNYLLFTIAASLLCAFLSSRYFLHGQIDMVNKMLSLQDSATAGHSRYIIWQPALELFKASPLVGIGLGTYFLAIPPIQDIHDTTAGYFVHNDYLQIALETGIIGLVLLLLVPLYVVIDFLKALRNRATEELAESTELVALFCALVTVAFHSFFSYNLYILPIMMMVGLILARFHQIILRNQQTTVFSFRIKNKIKLIVYYLCVSGLFAISIVYFVSIWRADVNSKLAVELAVKGKLQEAHNLFARSQALDPDLDSYYSVDAYLLIESARAVPASENRDTLLKLAKDKLDRALLLNRYRPNTPYLMGQWYEVSNSRDFNAISQQYEKALALNPRFLPARIALAKRFLAKNKLQSAYIVIKQGIKYPYQSVTPELLKYASLVIDVSKRYGDKTLFTEMTKKRAELEALAKEKNGQGESPFQPF